MASCFSYTQQFIHPCPLALCFTHINLFARALWSRSRCAPLATHDTHSNNFHPCPMAACFTHNNLFARDLWPRDLHTTICSLVPCGLVLGTQQFIHSCPVACLTHNNLLARALWPRSRCAPLATHDTHSNVFTRAPWPRALHTTICSLVRCGLVF